MLCESIAKLVMNVRKWDSLIPLVLFAYRTAKQNTTKITPFYLVYGREARFPIHPSEIEEEILEDTFLQRLFELIEILPQVRSDVVKWVEKAQESAKRKHDHQLPHIEEIKKGELVLVYKASQQHSKSHKLPINRKLLKKYYDRSESL